MLQFLSSCHPCKLSLALADESQPAHVQPGMHRMHRSACCYSCKQQCHDSVRLQALLHLVYYIAVVQLAETWQVMPAGESTLPGIELMMAPSLVPFLRRAYIARCQMLSLPAADTYSSLQCVNDRVHTSALALLPDRTDKISCNMASHMLTHICLHLCSICAARSLPLLKPVNGCCGGSWHQGTAALLPASAVCFCKRLC